MPLQPDYVSLLTHYLHHASLRGSENAWLFSSLDKTLTSAIRDAVTSIAERWLQTQTESTLRALYFHHMSIHHIFGDDIAKKFVEFLGPDPTENVPMLLPTTDALSSCLLVNKEWNKFSTRLRYKNFSDEGIRLQRGENQITKRQFDKEWANSFGHCWKRVRPHNLKIVDEQYGTEGDSLTRACFKGIKTVCSKLQDLRIQHISIDVQFLEHIDFSLPLFSHLLTVQGAQDEEYEKVYSFLSALNELPSESRVLEEFSVPFLATKDDFDSEEFRDIPSLFPVSIKRLYMPCLPIRSTWVADIIRACPFIETLKSFKTSNETESAATMDEESLTHLLQVTTLVSLRIFLCPLLNFDRLVFFIRKIMMSNPRLDYIALMSRPESEVILLREALAFDNAIVNKVLMEGCTTYDIYIYIKRNPF